MNTIYPTALEKLLQGSINLNSTIKLLAVDTAEYTYSATHSTLSDVPAAARIATSSALTGKSFSAGVFDADDPTFSAVTGQRFEALVLFLDSGTENTSHLVLYMDTATGLPFTPSGSNVIFNISPSGLFRI